MNIWFKIIYALLIISLFSNTSFVVPPAQANGIVLPKPGVRVDLSPALNPPMLKGLKVHPDKPFQFDFILDQGDPHLSPPNASVGGPQKEQLKTEVNKLIKYFLASLTIPENDLWVNLSPSDWVKCHQVLIRSPV